MQDDATKRDKSALPWGGREKDRKILSSYDGRGRNGTDPLRVAHVMLHDAEDVYWGMNRSLVRVASICRTDFGN